MTKLNGPLDEDLKTETKNILGAYLLRHPLEETLRFPVPSLFPPCRDRAAWESLPKELLNELSEIAEGYDARPFPVLRASDYMAYTRENDRQRMEKPYFLRRKKLMAVLLRFCAFHEEKDLTALGDMLWSLCEESSWVISAHNGDRPLPDEDDPGLELFSAQTGMILSLCLLLCGEELDGLCPGFRVRAEKEIGRRVIGLFETRSDLWWTGFSYRSDLCNWTPWIVSNVMLCACVCVKEKQRLSRLLTRACLMLDRYINIMPSDGSCDEGAGYWNMAGGALLDALELLRFVTGGRMDLYANEKLRGILSFPARVWLGGKSFVNFADCDARPYLSAERLRTAGRVTGDRALETLGAAMEAGMEPGFSDTPQLWRVLSRLFERPEKAPEEEALPPRDGYLGGIEVRVFERGGLTLVCKGGNNHENHNHNDVGSFMVYKKDKGLIVDAGNMTYSRLTFSDRRYTLWNTRSENHNVPLIAGREQRSGSDARARGVRCLPDGLFVDMTQAYEEGTAESCTREMRNTEQGVWIRDRIRLTGEGNVQYVFLLGERPRILDGAAVTPEITVRPGRTLSARVTEIPVTDPRMARNWPGSLYRLVFETPAAAAHDDTFRITLNRPGQAGGGEGPVSFDGEPACPGTT